MSYKTPKHKHSTKKSDLVERHLGIIAQRCLFWYRFLPISVRNYYDLEDMIGEVVIQVVRKTPHFNSKRGKESTMVWHTADNMCKDILMHHNRQKFTACQTIELTPTISRKFAVEENEEYRLSLNAVERVIAFGSDALLDLIEIVLTGSLKECKISITEELITEFRKVTRAQSASFDDFIRVFRYAAA